MFQSEEFNPYKPPESEERGQVYHVSNDNTLCWAEGKVLVVPIEHGQLPHRCVYCNEPVANLEEKKYYWHNPFIFLLILLNLLLYLIVALCARKKVPLQLGFCEAHKKKRFRKIMIGWGLFAMTVVCFYIGISGTVELILAGILLLIVSLLYINNVSRIVYLAKIKDGNAYFKKCGKDFLNSLHQNMGR